jgi:hypothetical protein
LFVGSALASGIVGFVGLAVASAAVPTVQPPSPASCSTGGPNPCLFTVEVPGVGSFSFTVAPDGNASLVTVGSGLTPGASGEIAVSFVKDATTHFVQVDLEDVDGVLTPVAHVEETGEVEHSDDPASAGSAGHQEGASSSDLGGAHQSGTHEAEKKDDQAGSHESGSHQSGTDGPSTDSNAHPETHSNG